MSYRFSFALLGFSLSSATAFASETSSAQNPLIQFVPFIFILAAFYFFIIMPSKKRSAQQKSMVDSLKTGTFVYTSLGITAIIVKIEDKKVIAEISPGIPVELEKSAIIGVAEDKQSAVWPKSKSSQRPPRNRKKPYNKNKSGLIEAPKENQQNQPKKSPKNDETDNSPKEVQSEESASKE